MKMHKPYVFVLVFFILFLPLSISEPVIAISQNLLISQIKAGNTSSSRLVEIYNNSDSSIDITGWCLYYSSPSNSTPYTNLGCFNGFSKSVREVISAKSYALLASVQTGLASDLILTQGLGLGTSGHVYLFDGSGVEIDRVGWGSAVNSESNPIQPGVNKVIERKKLNDTNLLIDTDDNSFDFFNSELRDEYQYGLIYEEVDVCTNIAGIQQTPPLGYEVDDNNNCFIPPVDICQNIEGLQTTAPEGYQLDESGNCFRDDCLNLDGLQSGLPDGYRLDYENNCVLKPMPLKITELLPNAAGSDDGNEFIELYNPNNYKIKLNNYFIRTKNSETNYYFPASGSINPKDYSTFSNNDINFTLVNTTSNVSLFYFDGEPVDETPAYDKPKDGEAWALINGLWQYTNRPTPGRENLISLVKTKSVSYKSSKSKLVPCAPNQYRNPATNRCKLISSSVSRLVPCKEGQERNPLTNRCRSISAVLGTSQLKPCKEGQERNPLTNRCRNIVKSIPKAEYAPQQSSKSSNNYTVLWSLLVLGIFAVGYAVWEWRNEIFGIFNATKRMIFRTK